MSTNPIALIQQKMDAIDRRWRWLKFWQYLGTTGALFSLAWLAIEILAWRGILTEPWLFYTLATLFVLGAVLAFFAIGLVMLIREPKRAWLADKLETGCPTLLDRINTLVFLEKLRRPQQFFLKRKIEEQAAQVFEKQPIVIPFSVRPALQQLAFFALALIVTIAFNHRYHPFDKLLNPPPTLAPSKDTPFELVPGNVTENKAASKPWGEVRIVSPGHDVKLTKIDVLPLQIEMTASASLKDPAWITSVNGGPEVSHPLPSPTEPQYAVYQPLVYLDELKVSDWDVVSYYARVETAVPATYVSKIYFIEIRPFHQDFQKGGKDGDGKDGQGKKARDLLKELIGHINQQMDMVQQTHLFQQTTYPTDVLRKQDLKKLTDAEAARAQAADQFYGEIVAENENAPIGEILDHLAEAEQHMNKATENLSEDIIPEAKSHEQSALAELVACRKAFLKVLSQHPGAFGDGDGTAADPGDHPPIATAQDSLKAMSQVTEMHDRNETALKSLHQLDQQQHALAQTVDNANGGSQAKSERELKEKIDKLMKDNPDLFRAVDAEKEALESDMSQAISNLESNGYEARHYADHAADDMNDLEKAVQSHHQLQQLAEAYKLKKIVDQNIQQLGQEKNKPGSLSPQDIKDLSDSAKRSTGTLKEISDSPAGAGFGPELGKSLSVENQEALQKALDELAQAQPGAASQGAAGSAQGNLAKVSQAFEQSQPSLTKQLHLQDPMQVSSGDALDQAAQHLQGLILAQQKKKPPTDEEQNKQLDEILGDLNDGLAKDTTSQGADILLQAHNLKKAKDGKPIDPDALKKLLDQIQAISAEANDPNKDKPKDTPITVIDSSKFPANYRDRIRTYYEQLSNHNQ